MRQYKEFVIAVSKIDPEVYLEEDYIECGMCHKRSWAGDHEDNCLWLWAKRLVKKMR